MSEKACCFIGHRNVEDTEELRQRIRETVERLVTKEGVTFFLFGSRSDFDSVCHDIVTELQELYPNIQRVAYTCRHETATMKEDKADEERIWSNIFIVVFYGENSKTQKNMLKALLSREKYATITVCNYRKG